MSATTGSRPKKPPAKPPAKPRGSSGGSKQNPLTVIAGTVAMLFLLVCTVGVMTGVSPSDVGPWILGLGRAAATKVDAARCVLHTCPRDDAAAALDRLRVAPEGPATGYSRRQFGPIWADVDRNGCDTRDDILARDLTGPALRPGSRCVVISGTLDDPYTGIHVTFTKARAVSVEIDHVVALGEAWRSGARAWTAAQRLAYANDPLVLQATAGPVNRAKSDHDAAEPWEQRGHDDRPTGGRACDYAKKVVAIKVKYTLTVDPAEVTALRRDLAACTS